MSKIIDNPKELILEKAKEIISKEGYSGLSIRKIAKLCDMGVGTIYNYYSNKKDIVIELMTEYWEEYLKSLDNVLSSKGDFYSKLKAIRSELYTTIKSFKEIWLKDEFYNEPGYLESGLQRENLYMDKLAYRIKELLEAELDDSSNTKIDTLEIAKFINCNLIASIQMPFYNYDTFESILKKLLK